MNLTGPINKVDMVNGYGLRVSIFVSGCGHQCEGCFSKHTWDKEAGYKLTEEIIAEIIEACSQDGIDGLSILGGDPLMDYNYKDTLSLCQRFKKELPNKTLYIWTGYSHERVLSTMPEVVELANVIITGRFEQDNRKDKRKLLYRGSENQVYIVNGVTCEDFPSVCEEGLPSCLNCKFNDESYSIGGRWTCHHRDNYGMETKSNYNKCKNWKGDEAWQKN